MEDSCIGHVNGYTHLPLDDLGIDYDLGFTFEESESEEFRLDPYTGLKVWAEPSLILCVSVRHPNLTGLPTLRYGLTRSQADRGDLLKKARPRIVADAKTLQSEGKPDAASKVVML